MLIIESCFVHTTFLNPNHRLSLRLRPPPSPPPMSTKRHSLWTTAYLQGRILRPWSGLLLNYTVIYQPRWCSLARTRSILSADCESWSTLHRDSLKSGDPAHLTPSRARDTHCGRGLAFISVTCALNQTHPAPTLLVSIAAWHVARRIKPAGTGNLSLRSNAARYVRRRGRTTHTCFFIILWLPHSGAHTLYIHRLGQRVL